MMMGVYNSKYAGGGMNVSPHSVTNDGMVELNIFTDKKPTYGSFANIVEEMSKYQGVHIYEESIQTVRGKNFRVENASLPDEETGLRNLE